MLTDFVLLHNALSSISALTVRLVHIMSVHVRINPGACVSSRCIDRRAEDRPIPPLKSDSARILYAVACNGPTQSLVNPRLSTALKCPATRARQAISTPAVMAIFRSAKTYREGETAGCCPGPSIVVLIVSA